MHYVPAMCDINNNNLTVLLGIKNAVITPGKRTGWW